MLSLIKNLTSSAASFLSSGSAPAEISQTHKDYERLKSLNHMESPKFFVCIVSAAILSFFYFISVAIIFFLPETVPGVATAFVTMFSKTTEILAVIIASYVGAQAVVDLKYNSSSNASIENKTETITQEITVIHTNQKDNDYELE